MQRKRFSEEQIIKALKSNKEGVKVADICFKLGIAKQTFYRYSPYILKEPIPPPEKKDTELLIPDYPEEPWEIFVENIDRKPPQW